MLLLASCTYHSGGGLVGLRSILSAENFIGTASRKPNAMWLKVLLIYADHKASGSLIFAANPL